MSADESAAIENLRQTIRWLIGGVVGLLAGAATVGGWVATQEGRITALQESDRASAIDRSGLHTRVQLQSEMIGMIRQDTAVQNRDLLFIREAVTEIKQVLKR
jgi:heme A synthase